MFEPWPALPGTYVLFLQAAHPLAVLAGRLGPYDLPVGDYAYVGSARGPGGLAARLRRHLRSDKPHHWHIDYLTAQLPVGLVLAVADAFNHECTWLRTLLAVPGTTVPIPGFGSSDCRAGCPAHLIHLPPGCLLAELQEELRHETR